MKIFVIILSKICIVTNLWTICLLNNVFLQVLPFQFSRPFTPGIPMTMWSISLKDLLKFPVLALLTNCLIFMIFCAVDRDIEVILEIILISHLWLWIKQTTCCKLCIHMTRIILKSVSDEKLLYFYEKFLPPSIFVIQWI